jgi:putative ABC transport system ATP-binding protein
MAQTLLTQTSKKKNEVVANEKPAVKPDKEPKQTENTPRTDQDAQSASTNHINMSKAIVEAKQVSKVYFQGKANELWALKEANISVNAGEMVSIMGPSGSGKTTLLNCISGIDEATSGEVVIDGQDLQSLRDKEKTKYRASKMGFIFQTFNLIPVLTAVENVEMPLLVNNLSTAEAREKAVEMLTRVGLGDRLHHKPAELSGGQRQRVTVARALVHNPAVVWADEPTGNLDTKTADEIMQMMIQLNQEYNQTFVIITHDQDVADKTQRIIHMRDGKVLD